MGALDGLTILRYGHMYDTRGGLEQYLSDLNGALSERSSLTTIQVQMTSDPQRVGETVRTLGRGRLVQISLFVDPASHARAIQGDGAGGGLMSGRCKGWLREQIFFAPRLYRSVTRPWLRRRRSVRRPGEPAGAALTIREAHRRMGVDLICLHTAGGADAAEVLEAGAGAGIPAVYIHHFANDRLAGFAMGSQLERVAAVAGVCGVDVPRYLAGRFRNVSDGIDTDFYRREKARALGRKFDGPVIFLPARLTPSKGQADLVRAAGHLRRRGYACHVALAGRTESEAFLAELKRLARQEGVADRVEFLGPLGPEELRDWYAAAAVLGFPTLHHEGLGRISIEAQAMETPPVVYRIGGTPESLEDGRTGLLIEPGDQAGLCAGLGRLLGDEALRRRMGTAGRAFVESQFGLTPLAERHERLLLSALGRL